MKKSDTKILNLLAFFALIIVAILIVVNNLLPIIGIEIKGALFNLLNTIKEIFILIIVGISAYNYVAGKTKGWTIAFWIAVIIFVVGVVLIWF